MREILDAIRKGPVLILCRVNEPRAVRLTTESIFILLSVSLISPGK